MDKLAIGICFFCHHPLAESGLIEAHKSEDHRAILKEMKCITCGAAFALTQRLMSPSTLTKEQLMARMNVNW